MAVVFDFRVSVIIPVYNTKRYLERTISSVLDLDEVCEIILIDDGSKDGSIEFCKEWSEKHDKIFFFQHEGGGNKGRGETRNFGIKKASHEFIAFLDSDDIYLPNRFSMTKQVFANHPNIDGVYEAIGIYFENEIDRLKWEQRFNFNLTTVNQDLNKRKLFRSILWGTHGHFSGNALTLRKSSLRKSGYFPNFKVAEDTHLFLRMALTCNLKAGNIKSETGLRLVHPRNSVMGNRKEISKYHIAVYKDLLKWCSDNKLSFSVKTEIRMRLFLQYFKHFRY